MTAVDMSSNLLARAETAATERQLDIEYVHGDVTTTDWWDGVAFDGALCNMALMDIDEAGTAPPSWSPEHGYSWEGRWSTQGTGVRGHADVNHRTLATYLNAMVEHGLILEEFAEPDSSNVPRYLAVRCRSGG